MLNAFRHHGIGHWYLACDPGMIDTCSTPSGIMESVTVHRRYARAPATGAQRLPASWNRSLASRGTSSAMGECSTPSGIMESVTAHAAPHAAAAAVVLNAFRHHGIGHPAA